GLEGRAVLDPEAPQVAEPDRLARALEAARGLRDDLFRRVRDLVLDVAVVAEAGGHRLQAVARLLLLARERHDREELRLRLGELLAGLDRGQVEALEVRVDRVRRAAALGNGLDHGRGADPDVAGAEHARPIREERDGVGLEALVLRRLRAFRPGPDPVELRALADGEEHPVARDRELRPSGRLRSAPPGRVGLARLHPDELDPGDRALLVGDDARRAGLEDRLDAFLDRLVDLVRRRHVLHVAAVDERHFGRALADRRPAAVHRREPAADDDDPLAGMPRIGQAE